MLAFAGPRSLPLSSLFLPSPLAFFGQPAHRRVLSSYRCASPTLPLPRPPHLSSARFYPLKPSRSHSRTSPNRSVSEFLSTTSTRAMTTSNGKKQAESHDDGHPSNHQAGESTEGKHSWKERPPYSIHKKGDFDVKLRASCHCGKVRYELSRDTPLDSKLCHCKTCQKQHAAAFQWAAIFHKTDINFVDGHHNLEWYDPTGKSIEHKLPCKVRCNYCHSPIMDEGRNMILLFPTMIDFESQAARDKFKPRMHMFYTERVIDIPDGLPKWSGLNEDSELIEDSPPEAVRKRTKQELEQEDDDKAGKEGKKARNGD